jgi:5-methylcytosine-specific restriction endonuclease McrA/endogenous inhibitor of DNA gyrase (YacG/DUF329 family)
MPTKECARCGQEFTDGTNALYCKPCRPIARKEYKATWYQDHWQLHAASDITIKCEVCGTEVVTKARNRRFCSECRRKLYNEKSNEKYRNASSFKGYYLTTCQRCGIEIKTGCSTTKFCPSCFKISRKQYNRDYNSKYYPENFQKWVRYNVRRRNNIFDSEEHYSTKQILALASEQNQCCYYCGESFFKNGTLEYYFEIEHKTPLSRGGSDSIENIALACNSCNTRKHTKTEEEFVSQVVAPLKRD